MTRVALTALEVANCGPWQGRHRFVFPSHGLAVFCAPNETGKTTLLRLVAAVIWGYEVPPCNWFAEDEAYEARLEYERRPIASKTASKQDNGPERFQISRDFRTHRVTLFWGKNGQWQPLRTSQHKQRGKTADSEQWASLVQKSFAPISPEAFVRLAMLVSPFDPQPEARLVQSLISGAGENTKDEALQTLLERYRVITRFSRAAGIGKADARKDGRLDELRQKQNQLQWDIAAAKRALEEGLRLREKIEQLDTQIANLEKRRQDLIQNKDILDAVRRLSRERRMKDERETSLKRALEQWKKLENDREQVRNKQAAFPPLLRDSTAERRQQWKNSLEELQNLAQRLVEKSAEVSEEDLRRDFSDVWNWPEDAPLWVEQIQQATESCRQLEQRSREAASRLEAIRPVLDRRRQLPVVLGVAVGTALVFFVILLLLGHIGLGLLLGGICGIIAGLVTSQIFRPQCWPPEYAECQGLAEVAREEHQRAARKLEKLWDDAFSWTQTRELSVLLQLLGRFQSLHRAKEDFAREKSELEALASRLTAEALPDELRELCALTGKPLSGDKPLSPEVFRGARKVLDEFEALCSRDRECQGQQETLLRSTGAKDIQTLEERHREAELDLQGNLLEWRQLAQASPLAEEALSWDSQKLESEFRRLEKQVAQLENDAEKRRQERNNCERELARWEGQNVVNLAQCQEELAQIEQEIKALEARARAVAQAYRLVEEAFNVFSQQHRLAIQSNLNHLMSSWTGRTDREFLLNKDFAVSFRIPSLGSQTEKLSDFRELSQGTCDQLALAIRWAVLDRLAGDVILPLLLDDCFHMWDVNRRDNLRRFLREHAERQMILVTHDEEFLSWGTAVKHEKVA